MILVASILEVIVVVDLPYLVLLLRNLLHGNHIVEPLLDKVIFVILVVSLVGILLRTYTDNQKVRSSMFIVTNCFQK